MQIYKYQQKFQINVAHLLCHNNGNGQLRLHDFQSDQGNKIVIDWINTFYQELIKYLIFSYLINLFLF